MPIATTSCGPRDALPPVPVVVRALGESGAAVVGAEIFAGASLVARTGDDGRARLDVQGAEGDAFDVTVRCPAGFRSPAAPVTVRRLGIGASASPPEYAVTCHETRHALVLAVRADQGPDLPVLYLGKEIARTDESGAAHVSFDLDPHDRVELVLGTSAKEAESLHPQNPAATFEVSDHDDIQVFAVSFTRDAKKGPARYAPRGPVAF